MGTKTIRLREDTYRRLKARKRDDESFTDLLERLLDDTTVNWHERFGTRETDELDELERAIERSRTQGSVGLAQRQQEAFESLSECDTDTNADETP